jgi:hypothetical protein
MEYETFKEIYDAWINKSKNEIFWNNAIAIKYDYSSTEAIRSAFKRGRIKYAKNIENLKGEIQPETNCGTAKVLIFDIEFSLLECYVFDLWEQNISIDQIKTYPFLLGWSAKYLNDSQIYSEVLTSEEAIAKDDYRIVKDIWKLINESDILIGHNILGYDEKKLNTRFLFYNLPPIKKHFSIDTLQVSRNNFSFSSNKMKFINKFLDIRQKKDNEGIDLWIKCMNGDSKALEDMQTYNIGDIYSSESLYYRLRPFIKGHPSLALFFDTNEERCPNCGSLELAEEGKWLTPQGMYKSLRCKCGAVCRSKQNELSKEKKKSLKIN